MVYIFLRVSRNFLPSASFMACTPSVNMQDSRDPVPLEIAINKFWKTVPDFLRFRSSVAKETHEHRVVFLFSTSSLPKYKSF